MTTLLGRVTYERAYYYCPHCRSGCCPTDETFRLNNRRTPAACEVMALLGVQDAFAESANRSLYKTTGLNASTSTVRRVTEAVGEDIAARRDAGDTFVPDERWDWNTDAAGRKVAGVSLDATGVRQQGKNGEQQEGRMPWVGVVFNPDLADPNARGEKKKTKTARGGVLQQSRYVSGLMTLEQIGAQLRTECRSVGLASCDVVVALSDGGNGLENCLLDVVSGLAKEVVFILDFWHVADHLQNFANVYLTDDDERRDWMKQWCHALKHQGGAWVVSQLETLDVTARSTGVRNELSNLLNYLKSNNHRTDYPTYVAAGWPIGSGKVESACKNVVGGRLKGSGMRWRESGTTSMCQLRALFKSEPKLWQAYWNPASTA